MKRSRVRWGFAAAVSAAALILAPLSPAAAATTVVSAVDFEDGTTGAWTQSGGGAGTLSVVDIDGGKALLVTGRDADYVGLQSPAGIYAPGTTYSFSMRAKLADGTAGTAGIRFVMKPSYTWIGNTTMTADAWTTVAGEFTVPADADPAALQIYIGTGDLTGPYDYLVDDISVTTEETDVPGGTTAISTDFESGLDGWGPRDSGSGAPVVAITTADAHTGAQSAAVTARTSQGSGIGRDVTGVLESGVTYELSAWVRFGASQPTDAVWLSMARTVAGATTYSTLGQFTGVSNSGWTEVTTTFTMGPADSALLYFETNYNGTNTSDLYIDDVVVVTPEPAVVQDLLPLKDTTDFPVGVAIDSRETTGAASELLLRHFDQVTSENYMKPEAWYNAAGVFTPHPEADTLMQYAQTNDLDVYGHTLVWHSQTPAFFFQDAAGQPLTSSEGDQQIMRDRLRTHIFAVAEYLSTTYGAFGSDTNPSLSASGCDGS